jgi:hypothetical protein
MTRTLVPFVTGFLMATLIFCRPGLRRLNDTLRDQVRALREKVFVLESQLTSRENGDWWKHEKGC